MIVIDIETTGINPRSHCMLSLGAVDYKTGNEFYDECCIYPDTVVDPFAMKINGMDIRNHLPGMKMEAHALYYKFTQWASTCEDNNILAGHNIGHFDILFLEHYAQAFTWLFPFSYRTVDLHSLAFLVFGKSMKHSDICRELGLPPEHKPHHALTGARSEATAIRHIISRFNMFMSPADFSASGRLFQFHNR